MGDLDPDFVRQCLDRIEKKLDKQANRLYLHEHDYVTPRYMWTSIITVVSLTIAGLALFF